MIFGIGLIAVISLLQVKNALRYRNRKEAVVFVIFAVCAAASAAYVTEHSAAPTLAGMALRLIRVR